ncbi:MAG: NDP-sugar synthase [Armatimonadetes bacterium]|nr:NDP-sugar synthase [Armatimonadota bacterium]
MGDHAPGQASDRIPGREPGARSFAPDGRGREGSAGGTAVQQAVLLVGGHGTRLRPLTYLLPKALIPVANLPLIAYEIIPLVRAGVGQIIFAVGYKADLLRRELGDGSAWGAEFVYVEESSPLGTAGAIRNVGGRIDGPFFVLNGDIIYDVDLGALAADHVERKALVTFCLRQTDEIGQFGLIQWHDDGRVHEFSEKVRHDPTGRNTVNSGFYVMSPEILDHIPADQPYSSERELFPALLSAGCRLFAHLPQDQGYWADVGRLDSYLQASGDVLDGVLRWYQPPRDGDIAPEAAVASSVSVARGARIGPRARLGPRVAVGASAVVSEGACVTNSIIWPGSEIGPDARVSDAIVAGATVAAGRVITSEVIVG